MLPPATTPPATTRDAVRERYSLRDDIDAATEWMDVDTRTLLMAEKADTQGAKAARNHNKSAILFESNH